MLNVIKIAVRNLRRYQRRTILTSALITLGVVAVLRPPLTICRLIVI